MKKSQFKQEIKEKGIDCAILFALEGRKDPNLSYLLQKEADFACLVIGKKDLILVSKSEKQKFGIKRENICKRGELFSILKKNLKNCKTVGLNMDFVSANLLKKLRKELKNKKFKDVSKIFNSLRETKTKQEMKLIKTACRTTEEILEKLFKNFKKFKTPLDAAIFLKHEAEKKGHELAFPPIVTQNFKEIHPKIPGQKFRKGFCIIDFGVKYKGYCADITRTVYIGKPSDKEKKIYDLVLKAQKKTIENLKVNKRITSIQKEAEAGLGKYRKYFIHGLGHGIGVEIHEEPSLRADSKGKLKKGAVFTIEPGIYVKNIGIRIEDDVLLWDRPVVLTKIKKGLRII